MWFFTMQKPRQNLYMKYKISATLTVLAIAIFTISCKDDITDMGSSIQPESDVIELQASVFQLNSETKEFEYIYANQDSFLLGKFYDEKFGTISANILAQVMCPVDFVFPENWVADSARIEFVYRTWLGDNNSTMRIRAYELDGDSVFQYTASYPSNLDLSAFCKFQKPLGTIVVKAKDTSRDSMFFSIKLSDEFVERFKPTDNSVYKSTANFFNFFKGIYIDTDFGSSTMLNIYSLNLRYFYHYTYTDENGETQKVKLNISFPANKEVRQVNQIEVDRTTVSIPSNQTYVASPANYYTTVNLPLKQIKDTMENRVNGKDLVVNTVLMQVEADEVSGTNYLTIPSQILALKEDALESFFVDKKIPTANDTLASYGSYTTEIENSDTTYTYSFELSKLVASEIRKAKANGTDVPENLTLVLIPVQLATSYTSSGTTLTGASHYSRLSAVALKNQNSDVPIRLKTVYTGF